MVHCCTRICQVGPKQQLPQAVLLFITTTQTQYIISTYNLGTYKFYQLTNPKCTHILPFLSQQPPAAVSGGYRRGARGICPPPLQAHVR